MVTLLLGAAAITLLCIIVLLISLERQEGRSLAIEERIGGEDLAIPLLLIMTMALLCTAGLLGAPRRMTATPVPTTPNGAPAAITSRPTIRAAVPPVGATPSPIALPPPAPTTTVAAAGGIPGATDTTLAGIAPGSAVPASAAALGPQAQATVDRARARFAQVRALHFVLTTQGSLYLDAGRTQALTAAEGDLLRPDRVSLTATLSAGSVITQQRLIQIGGDAYLANMPTGTWEKAPAGFSYDAGFLFDHEGGVPAILGKGRDWQLVETVMVNGIATQHVRGLVPAASVNALVGSPMRGEEVNVDLYIQPTTADIERIMVSEQSSVVPANVLASRWTLDLSKQNETIVIEAPTLGG
ncbi:MAG: LppX_LprAFG lipoprotein [Thermomicrobia bacterium]|nr:LppX_LprAFG lipoprotein [Thermomicrobia bacterium]MCA1722678.1 LppX_LprAFG lipoprotein [Thermomicrobia bacterium]